MNMIYSLWVVVFVFSFGTMGAQENTEKKKKEKSSVNIVYIDEDEEKAIVGFPGAKVEVHEKNDTVAKITIGTRCFEFIEEGNKTNVRVVHVPRNRFKGHYAGVRLGFCNYLGPDKSSTIPDEIGYMELNSGKSMAFSINFLQYNIGLQKNKHNIGLVTGLGWTVYNYRLDNQFYITTNEDGDTYGEPIIDDKVEKSKIVSSFLNIPLMFEAQIPSKNRSKAYVSAGVYGGFRLGSHTKVVLSGNDKKKSRDDININPIQYGAMFQVGYKFIKLYGTYNFSTLFEKDKGPELYPYSIGITLARF